MKKSAIVGSLLILVSTAAWAAETASESKVLKVKGMHCGGCVANVRKAVCTEGRFASCEVALTNKKKELGEVRIQLKPGQEWEQDKLRSEIQDAGYELAK